MQQIASIQHVGCNNEFSIFIDAVVVLISPKLVDEIERRLRFDMESYFASIHDQQRWLRRNNDRLAHKWDCQDFVGHVKDTFLIRLSERNLKVKENMTNASINVPAFKDLRLYGEPLPNS